MIDRLKLKLMLDVLDAFAKRFRDHAILKGGMEMALFASPRETNDLDFVFVPFRSKNDVQHEILECLQRIDPNLRKSINSKHVKFWIKRDAAEIEVEISVSESMESVAVNTGVLAAQVGMTSHLVRVMKPEIALAHKIAAWNERRLMRDLYDIYYWYAIQKVKPDMVTLGLRLAKIESRIPAHKNRRSMSVATLCQELIDTINDIDQDAIESGLPMLPPSDRAGLAVVLQSQLRRLAPELLAAGG